MPLRLAVLVAALAAVVVAAPATATAADGEPGWERGSIRIEPLPGSAPLTLEGAGAYRGALEIRPAPGGGGLAAINHVPLEDYVRGIGEVPASWPAAAQEAQAIAARTYVLWQAAVGSGAPYRQAGADICDTQSCQVYRGVAGEERPHGDRWLAAVEATRGQVLLVGGRLIPTMYSSSNGGSSISGGAPWLPAVDDPDDLAVSPYAQWEARFPLDRVAAAFPGPGRLDAVSGSGRGVALRRVLDDGSAAEQQVDGATFRSTMNQGPAPAGVPVAVPSTRFGASTHDGTVVVRGGGFGHLVGMSQYGALGKAQRGWDAAQILGAYYGGTAPSALDPEQASRTIRVALEVGADRAVVELGGPARVIADDGTVLATVAEGRWELRPTGDGGGVRVLPPPGATDPLALDVVGVDTEGVLVRLSTPAQVRVGPPGGAPVRVAALGAGEHRLAVSLPPEGAALVVEADAGEGRRISLAVPPGGGPTVPTTPSGPSEHAPLDQTQTQPAAAELAAAPLPATTRRPLAVAGTATLLLLATGGGVLRRRLAA